MALEGKIKEFGAADIVQLISQQQKTGILQVVNKTDKSEFYFVDGQVIETRTFRPGNRDQMGEMLLRAGLLSDNDLRNTLEKQKNTYEHIGQILIRDGLASKEQLERAILTQAYETFYDILQWRDGSYRFITEDITIDARLSPIPSIESILLNVLRMIDEWPEVQQNIGSLDMVFDWMEGKRDEGLGPEESIVYGLIDGNDTVREIIDKSLLGKFSVCRILVDLLQKEAIKHTASKVKKRKKGQGSLHQKTVAIASYTALIIVAGLLLLLSAKLHENILPVLNSRQWKQSQINGCFQRIRVHKLEMAIEMFSFKQGRYPDSMNELVSAGVLRDDDLDFYDGLIAYSLKGDSYTIRLN